MAFKLPKESAEKRKMQKARFIKKSMFKPLEKKEEVSSQEKAEERARKRSGESYTDRMER